jgi:drug/metabolite transporter (DMT)-like permease
MSSAVMFALLAGASAATWTICLKLGAGKVNAALGGMVVAAFAFAVNALALLLLRAKGHEVAFHAPSFWLLALAGVAAAGVDVFQLIAYGHGLRATSSFIIGGTSALIVLIIGFAALHEPLTWVRAAAIALIVAGILLLQHEGA